MAGLEKLDLPKLSLLIKLFDVKKFARIHDGFHHHVFLPRLFRQIHDLLTILDARGHWHGAGDVLARFQGSDRLPGVIGNRRIDMDNVHPRVFQQILDIAVPSLHSESVTDRIELFPRALADRIHVGVRVTLVNGDELRSETEADNRHVNLLRTHFSQLMRTVISRNTQRLRAVYSQCPRGLSMEKGQAKAYCQDS